MLTQIIASRDAQILFKAGKNREGWFGSNELIAQVNHTIDIFERLTKGNAQGLFLFDNAPSHQKRAADALSAKGMGKSEFSFRLDFFRPNLLYVQILKMDGHSIVMVHACEMAPSQLVNANNSTFPFTIRRCLVGLRSTHEAIKNGVY